MENMESRICLRTENSRRRRKKAISLRLKVSMLFALVILSGKAFHRVGVPFKNHVSY